MDGMVPQSIMEELVRAQIKLFVESEDGERFINKHAKESLLSHFESRWGGIKEHINKAVESEIENVSKKLFNKGRYATEEIYIAGVKIWLEKNGYKVTIENKK